VGSHLTETEFNVAVQKATDRNLTVEVECRRGKAVQNTVLWSSLCLMWTQKLEIPVLSYAFRINIILKI